LTVHRALPGSASDFLSSQLVRRLNESVFQVGGCRRGPGIGPSKDGDARAFYHLSNRDPLEAAGRCARVVHIGGVRYKLYYGDTANTTGQLATSLPFLGPKRLLYADGAKSGLADRVDFEDWESQTAARDVAFLWPNGDLLDATAEGYIDDFHFMAPTGSLDLQVMYLAITNGTAVPLGAAAVLLNP
jgi:hypothetical protein